MSSSTPTSRSVRMTSRNPPVTRVKDSSGSQIVSVGDARDRVAGTTSQVPSASITGQLVQAGQSDGIPLGSGGVDFDIDQKTWDDAMAGAAGGDALVEYARYASRVAIPTQGVLADLSPVPKTPERPAGTQSMAEQGRRTKSPRSTLRTMMAAGRPPEL